MNLYLVKLNTMCLIKSVNVEDETTKIRLMELGIIDGARIKVTKKSLLKKTFLVEFNSTCFTLKENIAKQIEVVYA